MKARTLFFICLLIPVLFLLSIAASNKDYSNEALIGTWVNEEYDEIPGLSARIVLGPEGRYEGYTKISDTLPRERGFYRIMDSWTDSEGGKMYKLEVAFGYATFYFLGKVYNNGGEFEQVWATAIYGENLPTQIDAQNSMYHVYYKR
jgi:hypothetical protein